jgi:Holliday junction DNA helicase RuvA
VPGIGRKTAERLIVELRDRFKSEAVGGSAIGDGRVLTPEEDAVSALVALGYRAQDAAKAVTASRSEGDPVENIIRAALGRLAGGRA